jgi:hypothetical protein
MFGIDCELFNKEVESQASYESQLQSIIAEIKETCTFEINADAPVNSTGINFEHSPDVSVYKEASPPPLQCSIFTGRETDKFTFKNFLTQFNNVIDSKKNLAPSAKLAYLKGYCRDYALQMIEHLTISDENYKPAIELLTDEFLDVEHIIDETMKLILNSFPKYDVTYQETRVYLNKMRSVLHELKTFNIDLCSGASSGCKLISHIIFSKLPPALKKELNHTLHSNYPDINAIFLHYNECIKTLIRTSSLPFNKSSHSRPIEVQANRSNSSDSNFKSFKLNSS